jgi:hypothetical protein
VIEQTAPRSQRRQEHQEKSKFDFLGALGVFAILVQESNLPPIEIGPNEIAVRVVNGAGAHLLNRSILVGGPIWRSPRHGWRKPLLATRDARLGRDATVSPVGLAVGLSAGGGRAVSVGLGV